MDKTIRQTESINKVIANNWNGILDLSIRFGKTRIGLRLYKQFIEEQKGKALILVPSSTIKAGWIKEDEYIKANPILVTTSQLLALNDRKIVVDLLIVDECHKYIGETVYNLVNGNTVEYKHIVMLTGSLPSKPTLNKLTSISPIIDTITEKEALDNGWVSNYVEYNIPLELPDNLIVSYVDKSKVISNILQKYRNIHRYITVDGNSIFKDELDLIYSCASGKNTKRYGLIRPLGIMEAIINKMTGSPTEVWNTNQISAEAKALKSAIYSRNAIISTNEVKLKSVLYIYDTLKLPTICFSESIDFADRIAKDINKNFGDIAFAYHSKVESKELIDPHMRDYYRYKSGKKEGEPVIFSRKKQLEYHIECMKYNMTKFISTVKSLDEGITIPEIECIITTAGSTNPIQYKQRTGRAKTFTNPDKIARIYNLYFKDFAFNENTYVSRDRIKLELRQQNSQFVKEISLSDL